MTSLSAGEKGITREQATPTIYPNRYNNTKSIPILYLSPKNSLVDNTVDNKKTKVVNQIDALKALKSNTADFYEAGEEYSIDPYLIMAIAILESGGGQSVPPSSFNPFGRVCGKEYECVSARDATTGKMVYWIKFGSFEEAIFDEAEYLKRRYFDRGLNTIEKIGKVYAEDTYWPQKIRKIITQIKD